MPVENGNAFITGAETARFKGGGIDEGPDLNEDRRFCADDLRRMLGRCDELSAEKWAISTVPFAIIIRRKQKFWCLVTPFVNCTDKWKRICRRVTCSIVALSVLDQKTRSKS